MSLFRKGKHENEMREIREENLNRDFPELWAYVCPKEVTDIDFNCGHLWISTTGESTRQIEDAAITEDYMRNVAKKIALLSGVSFNAKQNRLSVDTESLRVTCIHESVANGHISVCLRKERAELRFTMEQAVLDGFCQTETFYMLVNFMRIGMNMTFCGNPGSGKTETLKNISSYIPAHEKVITIEDVSEIHYAAINPNHNCVEMKIGSDGYERCIIDALRMNPQWILFGESLGKNTQYLMECWSNGVNTMSTLHVSDTRNIPDKIVNALGMKTETERVINQVHNDVGIAVLLKKKTDEKKNVKRYIEQVCIFFRNDGQNGQALMVEDGVLYPERIPNHIRKKAQKELGHDMFTYGWETQS